MSRRRQQQSSVRLPWEDRRGIRRFLERSRLSVVLAVVVLGVFGLLVTRAAANRQKRTETRAAIGQIHRAVARFRADMGRCPRNITEMLHPPRGRMTYLHGEPPRRVGQRHPVDLSGAGRPRHPRGDLRGSERRLPGRRQHPVTSRSL
jgi:hypothetical protein